VVLSGKEVYAGRNRGYKETANFPRFSSLQRLRRRHRRLGSAPGSRRPDVAAEWNKNSETEEDTRRTVRWCNIECRFVSSPEYNDTRQSRINVNTVIVLTYVLARRVIHSFNIILIDLIFNIMEDHLILM